MTTINKSGTYELAVACDPIEALPGHYILEFKTRLDGTRHPDQWRTVFRTTTQDSGLEALGREIYTALQRGAL